MISEATYQRLDISKRDGTHGGYQLNAIGLSVSHFVHHSAMGWCEGYPFSCTQPIPSIIDNTSTSPRARQNPQLSRATLTLLFDTHSHREHTYAWMDRWCKCHCIHGRSSLFSRSSCDVYQQSTNTHYQPSFQKMCHQWLHFSIWWDTSWLLMGQNSKINGNTKKFI